MRHEPILILDFGSQYWIGRVRRFRRTIALVILLGISLACSQYSGPRLQSTNESPLRTPIPEAAIPSHWRTFTVGPFKFTGPADLRKKDVKGIDSEIYEYENKELSVGIEIGMYSTEREIHSFEYETGSIMVDGRPVKYTKTDLNKPAANAARNADGSTSKPVEKHLIVEVVFPEKNALVSVNYTQEGSTPLAIAILQSIRPK